MRYQEYKLFPTTVIRFDYSTHFSLDEQNKMISDIDMITNCAELMIESDLHPKYQSKSILFKEDAPEIWQKLKYSFLESCENYLSLVENFTKNQSSIKFTHTNAWFYKSWKSLNEKQYNPWHNHSPSFLSGIFYLNIPSENGIEGGTEFMDPRQNESHGCNMQIVEPINFTWIVFPGWMYHRSNRSNTETPRYVIAADSFMKVL